MEELQGQHAVLRDCIEQLTAVESARTTLMSHLREALQEQVGWPDYFTVAYYFARDDISKSYMVLLPGIQAGPSPQSTSGLSLLQILLGWEYYFAF